MMNLLARPTPIPLRPHETLVWRGQPCWRTLAVRVFHLRALVLYGCVLAFANALAARLQHLAPANAIRGEMPVVILGGMVVASVALAAWATGRTTLYTITNQRVVLQYGVALTATLSLPMRLIASVAVSDGAMADVPIELKPGRTVPFAKLWPHARPWRLTRPQPMLRALANAAAVAAELSRTVAAAQATEHAVIAERGQAAQPARELVAPL